MLLEYSSTAVVRHKYFSSTTLKEMFSNVDARCILDFTKESGFYQLTKLSKNHLINPVFRKRSTENRSTEKRPKLEKNVHGNNFHYEKNVH